MLHARSYAHHTGSDTHHTCWLRPQKLRLSLHNKISWYLWNVHSMHSTRRLEMEQNYEALAIASPKETPIELINTKLSYILLEASLFKTYILMSQAVHGKRWNQVHWGSSQLSACAVCKYWLALTYSACLSKQPCAFAIQPFLQSLIRPKSNFTLALLKRGRDLQNTHAAMSRLLENVLYM